jgi:hypothetical protein
VLVVEPLLVVLRAGRVEAPLAEALAKRGQGVAEWLAVVLAANEASRWGFEPTNPYQTSRMASTWSFRTSCERRRYLTSSAPNKTLFFICSKSSSVTGDRATAAVPYV